MVKVLFYYWDWKQQIDIGLVQRAIEAVFDGIHPPYITDDIPTVDWDQNTIAICSDLVSPEILGKLFVENNDGELDGWCYNEKKIPQPFEI